MLCRLLNPVNGEDLTTDLQKSEAVFKDPLSLQLNIGNTNSRDGFAFKVWKNGNEYIN